jgi:Holliday junction resolvase RusA-like endonuclease
MNTNRKAILIKGSDIMVGKPIMFWVPGIARTSGSHNSFQGRIVHASKYTKAWMDNVRWTAKREYGERQILLEGPIKFYAEFYLPRSKGDYGSGRNAGVLKPSAAQYHTKMPDADKLGRAVQDALSMIIYRDDKQIVDTHCRKFYETQDTPPGVSIKIEELMLGENQQKVLDNVKEKANLFKKDR